MWAARLAARPLLDLMTADVDWQAAGEGEAHGDQLASLERVEVYQATGFLIGSLDVTPADALVRLRAYAIGHSMPISDVAHAVLDRRLLPSADGDWTWTDGRDVR
jgi:AmiR/NasT family two-component response regulator